MKTCPYCGSEVNQLQNNSLFYCDFCCMNLDSSLVKENGERISVRVNECPLDTHIDKTTPQLMLLSTFELLYLLRAIRKERSDMFSHMNTFYQAGKQENSNEFKEYEIITGKDYMYFTKKAFVVENIIRTRLGYVPVKITEQFLAKYLDNIKKSKNGPMKIRTERRVKEVK